MGDKPLQPDSIRRRISQAVDIIVHFDRFGDGSRKVTHITEVDGIDGDEIALRDIFVFEHTGFNKARLSDICTQPGSSHDSLKSCK